MKKILLSSLLILSFIPAAMLPAREESAPARMALTAPSPQPEMTLPFEVTVGARRASPLHALGEWAKAWPGKIFTSGYHAPDFTLPSLKEDPAPIRYPRWAVREGWEGTFVIAVEILKTGQVGRWKVTETTGYPLLDQAATHAVRQWLFHAAREQGQPIISCIQIPIHFKLKK